MERNQVMDKYDKAKIEEPDPILPEFLQNIFGGNIPSEDLSFKEVFVSQAALEEKAEETDRKVYRIRNKDLFTTFGGKCEHMELIHIVSKARIAVLANAESDEHHHKYIDMVGTVGQVKTAEHLILNKVLKTYDSQVFPVILMPPVIHEEHVTIPLNKVEFFLGPNSSNLTKLEMESRTWMMIDRGPPSSELDRVVKVYGPRENVINAMSLVQSEIDKPGESSEAEKETEELFKKVQCVDKTDTENSDGTSEPDKGKKQIQVNEAAQLEKYAKAKIEDPTQLLPKSLLKVNMDQTTGELYYWKFFEDDYKKTKHLAEAVAAGEQTERKVHRIRDKELTKALGENYAHFDHIHKVSKCTIGLLSDTQSNECGQSLIHLMGTVNQVRTAEHLILDKILETYDRTFPVILMPPTIGEYQKKLPGRKIRRLFGDSYDDILPMEILSGAWIQFDTGPDCSKTERILHIYGPRPQVVKALNLVNSVIYEPWEALEAQRELDILFNELTFEEKESCNKSRFGEELEELEQEAKQKGANIEASSGSSSGQTEEQMQKHAVEKQEDVAEGDCGRASASGEVEHKG